MCIRDRSRGSGHPQGADRSRQDHTGHRTHLSTDRNRPGDRSCGRGTRPRQGRHHRGSNTMTPTRKTATVVGALFLTQTVAFIIAEQLITGVLKGPDYLTGIAAYANALTLGGLLAVVSGVAVVGIAVLLFPLLKPTSEPLALGYVCERVIELVLQLLFFLVVPLLMIAIGNGLRDGTV